MESLEDKIEKIVQDEAEKWMEERFGLVDGAIFNLPLMIIAKLKPILRHELLSYRREIVKEIRNKWDTRIEEVKKELKEEYVTGYTPHYEGILEIIMEDMLKV